MNWLISNIQCSVSYIPGHSETLHELFLIEPVPLKVTGFSKFRRVQVLMTSLEIQFYIPNAVQVECDSPTYVKGNTQGVPFEVGTENGVRILKEIYFIIIMLNMILIDVLQCNSLVIGFYTFDVSN